MTIGNSSDFRGDQMVLIEVSKNVASLTDSLESLTSAIGHKIAPEVDRLKGIGKDHTKKLNEIAEELGRLNRNMETLQAGLKRVINKVTEQEQRIDNLVSQQKKVD